MITITLIWIVVGQALHSVLRTSGVKAIAVSARWKAISLNASSHVVRATVMAGTVSTIMDTDYRGIIAVALGSIIGDWIALRSDKPSALHVNNIL